MMTSSSSGACSWSSRRCSRPRRSWRSRRSSSSRSSGAARRAGRWVVSVVAAAGERRALVAQAVVGDDDVAQRWRRRARPTRWGPGPSCRSRRRCRARARSTGVLRGHRPVGEPLAEELAGPGRAGRRRREADVLDLHLVVEVHDWVGGARDRCREGTGDENGRARFRSRPIISPTSAAPHPRRKCFCRHRRQRHGPDANCAGDPADRPDHAPANAWEKFFDPSRKTLDLDFLSENANAVTQYADWISAGEVQSRPGAARHRQPDAQ